MTILWAAVVVLGVLVRPVWIAPTQNPAELARVIEQYPASVRTRRRSACAAIRRAAGPGR